LYCMQNLKPGSWPRCPLLEKVFTEPVYDISDIIFPNITKPPRPNNHFEYKLVTIEQLSKILLSWISEKLDEKLICFYAYNYRPCTLRLMAIEPNLNVIITELNYNHPGSAQELKEIWDKLQKAAVEFDSQCKLIQKLPFIQPDMVSLHPIEAKQWAKVLLGKLGHIYNLVKSEKSAEPEPQGEDGPSNNDNEREINSKTKEQAWRDEAPDYISNSDAIVNFTNNKMTLPALSKLLIPDGSIRYMRKGQRCKVHIGDFREYASKHYVPDKLANEIADEVLANRAAQQEEEDRHKKRTGK